MCIRGLLAFLLSDTLGASSLQRAYEQVAGGSGRPLFATLLGHFETITDEQGGKQEVLVVDRFERLLIELESQAVVPETTHDERASHEAVLTKKGETTPLIRVRK
jgi:hypothetical protein